MNRIRNDKKGLSRFAEYFLLVALILAFIVFSIFCDDFLAVSNVMNILRSASIAVIVAIAAMLPMNVGEMNFAVGAQMTATASIVGKILDTPSFDNYVIAVIVALLISCVSGLICIGLVLKIKVPSFITTLAISTVLTAVCKFISGNKDYYSKYWPDSITVLGRTMVGAIPLPVIVMFVLAAVTFIIMEKTKIGRNMFSIGGNLTAARQVGINVDAYKTGVFFASSLIAGFAGVMSMSVTSNIPLTLGDNYLLPAISGSILGATFLMPGKFNVPGTIIAATLTIVIRVGVISAGASAYITDAIQGVILLVAIALIATLRKEGLPSVTFA